MPSSKAQFETFKAIADMDATLAEYIATTSGQRQLLVHKCHVGGGQKDWLEYAAEQLERDLNTPDLDVGQVVKFLGARNNAMLWNMFPTTRGRTCCQPARSCLFATPHKWERPNGSAKWEAAALPSMRWSTGSNEIGLHGARRAPLLPPRSWGLTASRAGIWGVLARRNQARRK